ncbi:MAG: LTA synthase family protein [Halarsenatibacteraceae bacterium]
MKNIVLMLAFIFIITQVYSDKKKIRILFLAYLVFSIIFIVGYLYYSYYGNYFSIIDYFMSENTGRAGNIRIFFENIRPLYLFSFVFDLILASILYLKIKTKNNLNRKIAFFKNRRFQVISIALILFLLIGQILYTNHQLGNYNPQELYHRSTPKFVNSYGYLPLYLIELYEIVNPYQLDETEPLPDIYKGELAGRGLIDDDTNIIAIQVETLDEKIIDYEYNGQEITPFLNQLKTESLYFPNFITQHIRGSYNADFSFLTSLYPINRNYPYRENNLEKFQSIVNVLNNYGYKTLAFHNYDGDFFNRNTAFSELNFDRYYSETDYSTEDIVMEAENNLRISDYDFFKQSLDYLEEAEEPFFSFFITVSSHNPFDYYPQSEEVAAFNDIEDELVKDLFNSFSFFDSSLEMFINQLDERGLKDNSLIIIYSDHESLVNRDEYFSGRDYNLTRNVKKPEHVPLFIIHPEIQNKIDERAVSILDLSPTILDLLGKTEMPEEFLGRSILDNEEYPILFLHEVPQVLSENQLYLFGEYRFEKIGYYDQNKDDSVITDPEKEKLRETIQYMRSLYLKQLK